MAIQWKRANYLIVRRTLSQILGLLSLNINFIKINTAKRKKLHRAQKQFCIYSNSGRGSVEKVKRIIIRILQRI